MLQRYTYKLCKINIIQYANFFFQVFNLQKDHDTKFGKENQMYAKQVSNH